MLLMIHEGSFKLHLPKACAILREFQMSLVNLYCNDSIKCPARLFIFGSSRKDAYWRVGTCTVRDVLLFFFFFLYIRM